MFRRGMARVRIVTTAGFLALVGLAIWVGPPQHQQRVQPIVGRKVGSGHSDAINTFESWQVGNKLLSFSYEQETLVAEDVTTITGAVVCRIRYQVVLGKVIRSEWVDPQDSHVVRSTQVPWTSSPIAGRDIVDFTLGPNGETIPLQGSYREDGTKVMYRITQNGVSQVETMEYDRQNQLTRRQFFPLP